MKPRIALLVVDLDNTLYDWVTFFVESFYAMIDAASTLLAIDKERLLDDMKEVHQRYHNSEQPFALLETRCVVERFGHLNRQARARALGSALSAFGKTRDRTLRLYPGVFEALTAVRRTCHVVGHTEASVANAVYRLRKLGVDSLVAPLYALRETGPDHPDPERAREYAALFAEVRILDQHQRKPDVRVLLDICRDQRVPPQQTLYVGDSISRDIGMAKSAGTWAAWAKYGTVYDRSRWERLVRVTHWTPADVERTKRAETQFGHTRPDITLGRFDEILDHFDFGSA